MLRKYHPSTLRKDILRSLRRWTTALVLISCTIVMCACERPFVEVQRPSIEVVGPDLSEVLMQSSAELRVDAESFRAIDFVQVNDDTMRYDPELGLWTHPVQLQFGLNRLVLRAWDDQGTVGVDTAFAVYLPIAFTVAPLSLPEPRGGHTTTLLNDGRVLVVGGAVNAIAPAAHDAFILRPGTTTFARLTEGLNYARTGHTATLLPDGRVLILGGSATEDLQSVSDLVEVVELFDPTTERFVTVPFEGQQPIRRAFHTATVRHTTSGTFIDLYGGRGDVRYGGDPRLGVRSDLRTFRFTGTALVEENYLATAPRLEAVWGHAQTPLTITSPGEPGSFLVTGSYFGEQPPDTVTFRIDYTSERFVLPAPPLRLPRIRHAGVQLFPGFVAVLGGRQADPTLVLDRAELFVAEAGQFFRFPDNPLPRKRYGHTATKVPSGRILILGGFTEAGNSQADSEYLDIGSVE